jgi:hypothetical protein
MNADFWLEAVNSVQGLDTADERCICDWLIVPKKAKEQYRRLVSDAFLFEGFSASAQSLLLSTQMHLYSAEYKATTGPEHPSNKNGSHSNLRYPNLCLLQQSSANGKYTHPAAGSKRTAPPTIRQTKICVHLRPDPRQSARTPSFPSPPTHLSPLTR